MSPLKRRGGVIGGKVGVAAQIREVSREHQLVALALGMLLTEIEHSVAAIKRFFWLA